MNKKLTVASVLAATVLAVGMFVSAPITTMAFNANNGNDWHVATNDELEANGLENPCATDDDLEEDPSGETKNGIWYHKTSPNGKDVFACKDHPEEQPEDDE
jgi:hypothetical protein